jgi:hypothetical protein
MDRRSFLKGLAAATGSSLFASTAIARLAPVPSEGNVIGYGYENAGNGFYRIWKTVRGNMNAGLSLSFGKDGLHVTPESRAMLSQTSDDEVTFSCYIKSPDVEPTIDIIEMWAEDKGDDWIVNESKHYPQIEIGAKPTSYIRTGDKDE